jgi:RNA polymerase sigma-70 factor (ECF subfamily)
MDRVGDAAAYRFGMRMIRTSVVEPADHWRHHPRVSNEAQLVSAWRAGDPAAGEALLRGCYPAIERFFRNKVGTAAEDLIQQTLVRAIEARERFEGRSSFKAYVLATARHTLYEYLRRLTRAPIDFTTSSIQALDPSPSQVAAENEEKREVLEALRTLPVEQQVLLELYYWEDLTIAELSEVVGAPAGTIKRRLHTAREQFGKSMRRNDTLRSVRAVRDRDVLDN